MNSALLPIQGALLQKLAGGASTAELLQDLALAIEAQLNDASVSVLGVNGKGRVRNVATGSLPRGFCRAIEGERIGPKAGSCGTAAYLRKPILVAEIATDPLWEDYRELALGYGLHACWSRPIFARDDSVIGTFAIYRTEPGLPDASEQALINESAALVQLLLERERREVELMVLRRGMELSPLPLMLADAELCILNANPALSHMFGYSLSELVGRGVDMLRSPSTSSEVYRELRQELAAGRSWRGELTERSAAGEDIPVELSVTPVSTAAPGTSHYFVVMLDLRERRAAEAALERLAFHDAVTGLPNRALLQDRLGRALAHARRERQSNALLFFDLDHFKLINDLHGHSQGDALLAAVATRLNAVLREEDSVARLGGDEFVVLTGRLGGDRLTAALHAQALAEKLSHALAQPFEVRGHSHALTASVGITVFPKGMESSEDLLREADTAMYQAKAAGRNTVVLFDPQMQQALHERDSLERDLRKALEQGELDVHLQPQVDQQGHVCAAEALLRWLHPRRGMVPPLSFIPLAEDSGLIVPIGQWVLQRVCGWLARCSAAGRPLHIAVNVSPRQFRESNFQDGIQQLLAASGADPLHLTLELTESLLIEDAEASAAVMQSLARLGLRFSIDDFGTGYSSLAYLKRLPLRELKIDKTFVQDICDDPNDAALVQTILAMASHLHLSVVAEGVETEAQSALLRQWGCQRQQGYWHGRPQPGDALIDTWLNGEGT